jgi:hypothetical protein
MAGQGGNVRNRIRVKAIAFGEDDGSATVDLQVRLWPRGKKKFLPFDPTELLQVMQDFLDLQDGGTDGNQE